MSKIDMNKANLEFIETITHERLKSLRDTWIKSPSEGIIRAIEYYNNVDWLLAEYSTLLKSNTFLRDRETYLNDKVNQAKARASNLEATLASIDDCLDEIKDLIKYEQDRHYFH